MILVRADQARSTKTAVVKAVLKKGRWLKVRREQLSRKVHGQAIPSF